MYEISVRTHFSAAHRLVSHKGSCANLHGHNWEVEVAVRGRQLDKIGVLMDFRELKGMVGEILEKLDHSDLNALPAFKGNPSSENIARHIYVLLKKKFRRSGCRVSRVTVHETPQTGAAYWEAE